MTKAIDLRKQCNMEKDLSKNYRNTEEYNYLVEHCRAAFGEHLKSSREELILAHLETGEEIVNNPLYKKYGKSNQNFLLDLFEDIGIGKSNGYYCVSGYNWLFEKTGEKEVSTAWKQLKGVLKEGDNISWNKIKTIYLLEPKEKDIPLPEGKYQVLLCDPPYPYPERQDAKNLYGAANYHYPTMTIEELKKLPIKELKTENSVLFMWVATHFLEESFELLKEWDMKYKSQMIWHKKGGQGGIGWYCWGDHEILLIATSGSFLPKKLFSSVYQSRREKHSKKPDYYYKMIETMYPNNKYIELFAKDNKKRPNWTYWGQEANA